LKVSLHAAYHPHLLVHQLASPAGEPLQPLVLGWDLWYLLEDILGHGEVVLEMKQLQDLADI
jgi:hypothetical protein